MSVMVGEIKLWSGENIPAGWLACNGQSLSVASYLPLYTVLGNLYGGDSTTFYIPDMRNRSARGAPESGMVGSTIGNDQVTLTNNHLPQHTHTASFTSSTTTSATSNIAIPANASTDDIINTPSNLTILAKGSTGSDPANIYTTSAVTTTLKPFDAPVTLPTITGNITVSNTGQASPMAVPITSPSILVHYIIAAVGVLPTY